MHYVGRRHWLEWVSCSAPGRQSADKHKRIESVLAQEVCHARAGHFASAGAVQIHVFVAREFLYFNVQIIGLDANRSGDSDSARTVVTMAAHIGDQDFCRTFRLQLRRERRHLYARHYAVGAMFPIQRNSMRGIPNHGDDDYRFDYVSCCAKSTDDLRHEVAEDESHRAVSERVGARTQEIQSQELEEGHFHA